MKPKQEDVNEIGNKFETLVTDFITEYKPTPELLIGMIAGLSNTIVCAAFAAWGPEFGLECITKAVNAAATKWKESEENERREKTKDSGQARS